MVITFEHIELALVQLARETVGKGGNIEVARVRSAVTEMRRLTPESKERLAALLTDIVN